MGTGATGTLKGREVVLPEHLLEGRSHPILIKLELVAVPAPGGQEEVRDPGVVDRVAIAPVGRREAGVPVRRDRRRRTHPDAGRETAIQGRGPAMGGDRTGAVEVNDLA